MSQNEELQKGRSPFGFPWVKPTSSLKEGHTIVFPDPTHLQVPLDTDPDPEQLRVSFPLSLAEATVERRRSRRAGDG